MADKVTLGAGRPPLVAPAPLPVVTPAPAKEAAAGLEAPRPREASATPMQLTIPAHEAVDPLAAAANAPELREALALQRDLIKARVRYGDALVRIEKLEAQGARTRGFEAATAALAGGLADGALSKRIMLEAAKAREAAAPLASAVSALEARESTTPADILSRARFLASIERFGELESAHGPAAAARMARQFHYNRDSWNMAAGTDTATPGEMLQIAMPYRNKEGDPDNDAELTAPNGEVVDLAHVYAGLDWKLNPDRFSVPRAAVDVARALGAPLPDMHDINFVEVAGDLGSAVARWDEQGFSNARDALMQEGLPDLRGDVDALNIAQGVRPGTRIRDQLARYYGGASPGSATRVDTLLSHWSYAPHGRVDIDRLARAATSAAVVLRQGWPTDARARARAVTVEFVEWLQRERGLEQIADNR